MPNQLVWVRYHGLAPEKRPHDYPWNTKQKNVVKAYDVADEHWHFPLSVLEKLYPPPRDDV